MVKKLKRLGFKSKIMVIFDFVGIILLWRGVWGLFDVFVFPGNPLMSYLCSILIGAVLIFIDGDGLRDLVGR